MNSRFPLVKMGQFLNLRKEFFTIDDAEEYQLVTVQLHARGIRERSRLMGSEIKTKKQQRVKAGYLLVAEIDAKVGGYGIVPSELDDAIVSGHYFLYEIDQSQIVPEYFGYYLQTGYSEQNLQQFVKGSVNYAAIRSQHFFELDIPLPALDDQRRIVERIKGLTVRISELHKLQLDAVEETKNLVTSSLNKIFSPEEMNCWTECSLGNLAEIVSGVTLGRSIGTATISVPYLRVANVQDGWLDLSEVKQVEIRPHELEKWRLLPGDLLLTEGGDFDKLGRGTVWREEVPDCIHQNHIFRVRLDQNRVLPDFVELEVRSSYGKDYFLSKAKKTTNLASINQTQLRAFPVRFPSIEKQYELIHRANQFKALTGSLAEYQEKSLASLSALLPSCLDRAFEGALT